LGEHDAAADTVQLADSLFYLTPPPGHYQRDTAPPARHSAAGTPAGAPSPPKLLVRLHEAIRLRQYSARTEEAYAYWVKRYVFFHRLRHPDAMGPREVEAFLSYLAQRESVSASTQNQALCALVFLYRHVLAKEVGLLDDLVRAKRPRRLPVVLTPQEVEAVFAHLEGVPLLVSRLLYGSGMRLFEGLGMRVKDLEFERQEITVRDGKGRKDRLTLLPATCVADLRAHLQAVRRIHDDDLARGLGRVALPDALSRKYPGADRQWGWQFVFPASTHYTDRRTGAQHRYHLHESVIQKHMAEAVRRCGLAKPATPHTLRHSFATELIRDGYDIRTVQELLGHKDVSTTMIYVHVLNRGGKGVRSPADRLPLTPRRPPPATAPPDGVFTRPPSRLITGRPPAPDDEQAG
jgi:integron integrase